MVDTQTAENVKLVQQLYIAFANRDIATILTALSLDVEWDEPDNPLNPAAGTKLGHAGFLEWIAIGNASEDVLILEPRQFFTGDNVVAVIGYTKCHAKPSGRIYETDFVHQITIQDGKITRFREFFDTYAAAEAFDPPADAGFNGPFCLRCVGTACPHNEYVGCVHAVGYTVWLSAGVSIGFLPLLGRVVFIIPRNHPGGLALTGGQVAKR